MFLLDLNCFLYGFSPRMEDVPVLVMSLRLLVCFTALDYGAICLLHSTSILLAVIKIISSQNATVKDITVNRG